MTDKLSSSQLLSPLLVILSLLFLFAPPAFSGESEMPAGLGIIKGQILSENGKPLTPGMVAFFASEKLDPMDYGQTLRSPKMISFLDKDGRFTTAMMPKGNYFVGAIPRKHGRGGPPKPDEKRYSAFDKDGKYHIVTLEEGQTLDIGAIKVKEPPAKQELSDSFTISGKLLDKDDKPLAGITVVLRKDYDNPKGEYISDDSTADGVYSLKIPPGKYFMVARKSVGGSMRPKPGSIYGELGQNKPIGVGAKRADPITFIVGTSGQVYKDVDIRMFKVPIPEVKRKETEALVKANKIRKEDISKDLPLRKKELKNEVKSKAKPEK